MNFVLATLKQGKHRVFKPAARINLDLVTEIYRSKDDDFTTIYFNCCCDVDQVFIEVIESPDVLLASAKKGG